MELEKIIELIHTVSESKPYTVYHGRRKSEDFHENRQTDKGHLPLLRLLLLFRQQ